MDIKVFPSILKNVEIDLDSLYSPHPNILYLSLEELKIYIKERRFKNLINAVRISPNIYREKGLNLNETFSKINPKNNLLTKEEESFIFKQRVKPSSILWTTYQHIVSLTQKVNISTEKTELMLMKSEIESAIYIKENASISPEEFKKFLYG
jgi:hypothetical protein